MPVELNILTIYFFLDHPNEHPIAYHTKLFKSSERGMITTEKECYAVIWALSKMRPYLEGYSFDIVTDHASLLWLKNLKDPTGKLGRWAMQLSAYDATIQHRPGAQNVVPDALSRAFEEHFAAIQDIDIIDPWYIDSSKQLIYDMDNKNI